MRSGDPWAHKRIPYGTWLMKKIGKLFDAKHPAPITPEQFEHSLKRGSK